ncbi:HalOD1 output domain-containing protein [Haladaptatus sp. CMAA 1911]|uniref:HalOD1 output domain-containing protein n=1 Tax=unclassified Haladaptatus TaxID=2622732 RepID=UPI003754B681
MSNASSSQPGPSIRTTPTDVESITATVVRAVAEANGTNPATPLYEVIDPDALEALYQHGSPKVTFEYIGYRITIHADRTVSVSELDSSDAVDIR